jgi:hypothetical protein
MIALVEELYQSKMTRAKHALTLIHQLQKHQTAERIN